MLPIYKTVQNLKTAWKSGDSLSTFLIRWKKNAGQIKNGTLVGTDRFGNQYYEENSDNVNSLTGRERWVEYAGWDKDATQIPPEWHSWLHYICDRPAPLATVPYLSTHQPNMSGTEMAYTPHNFRTNPRFNINSVKRVTEQSVRSRHFGFKVDDL
eukprot:TRINITY_DN6075_c0_g1_i1.p1 TRINITY_DN6075_c0_g1~~TRINITY_DN6075_c0_g1_i1.p1  ORF type:complete len:155 (-),score=9.67 TRINITY_DN6075_c0_g1_i1:78-542(-)